MCQMHAKLHSVKLVKKLSYIDPKHLWSHIFKVTCSRPFLRHCVILSQDCFFPQTKIIIHNIPTEYRSAYQDMVAENKISHGE